MMERVLDRDGREVVVLPAGRRSDAGAYDVVVTSGRVPPGIYGQTVIRLPAASASSTTGVLRRKGEVEIVQIPTLRVLIDLIDQTLSDDD